MNSIKTELTADSLAQFLAALREAVWQVLHVANYSVGPVERWPVSIRLSCRSCDVKAVATLRIGDLSKLWQGLEQQSFRCKCGSSMTDHPTLIKLATMEALTNLT